MILPRAHAADSGSSKFELSAGVTSIVAAARTAAKAIPPRAKARYRRAMPAILLVMIGGAVGSAARYLVGRAALSLLGPDYPWGTLAVNIFGGLLMGLLAGLLARFANGAEHARLLLAVGVLGGFTTFSSFSLEVVLMVERGDWVVAFGYILASVLGATLALFGGLLLVRAVA